MSYFLRLHQHILSFEQSDNYLGVDSRILMQYSNVGITRMTMFYIFLGLFIVASTVHLVFCFIENEKSRRITKCFCMVFLCISVIFSSNGAIKILLPFSCFFALLGDFFMLWQHKKTQLVLSGISFNIEHVLNLTIICLALSYVVPYYVFIVLGLLIVAVTVFGMLKVKNKINAIAFGYFAIHSVLLVFSVLLFIDSLQVTSLYPHKTPWVFCLMVLVGYVLFIISDIILALSKFKFTLKRKHFIIMLPYLVAQSLIFIGLSFSVIRTMLEG